MATYTVKTGDTLGAIARKLDVSLGVLIDANGITDPNKIKVGQVLEVPATTTDLMEHEPVAKPAAAVVAGEPAINRTKLRLAPAFYFQQENPKDLIVLHYTAGGSARSAFDTWVQAANRVATPYVVDLDGTIYEFFDPKYWAFHLGLSGAASAGDKHHKRSIGIEIVNVGVLKPDGVKAEQLNWWPKNFGTKYCTTAETGRYVKRSFRGFDFHAAYPEAQMASVAALVGYLCGRFGIEKKLPPVEKREAFDLAFATGFKGIVSHQNFRKDKFDVGPAFDWGRL